MQTLLRFINENSRNGNINEHHKYKYRACTKNADTVQKHAHCVINILDAVKKIEETHGRQFYYYTKYNRLIYSLLLYVNIVRLY